MQRAARFGLCSSAASESKSQSGSGAALGFHLGRDAGVDRSDLAQSGQALTPSCAPAEGSINVPGNRLELNARMAASLDAPVLMVLDANSASGVSDLVTKALVSRNGLLESRAEVLGLIVNKVALRDACTLSCALLRGGSLLPTQACPAKAPCESPAESAGATALPKELSLWCAWMVVCFMVTRAGLLTPLIMAPKHCRVSTSLRPWLHAARLLHALPHARCG